MIANEWFHLSITPGTDKRGPPTRQGTQPRRRCFRGHRRSSAHHAEPLNRSTTPHDTRRGAPASLIESSVSGDHRASPVEAVVDAAADDHAGVRRPMRKMGIAALGPKPRTTKPAPGHKIFPYLLRGLAIERPNHVW
jgi:hypothetical protein